MRVILALLAFFSVAIVFGIALVKTKWCERYEYEGIEDDES